MIAATRPEIALGAYPYPDKSATNNDWAKWLNDLMADIWEDISVELPPLMKRIDKLKNERVPVSDGWQRRESANEWVGIGYAELPNALALDVESKKDEQTGRWIPTTTVAYGNDERWYVHTNLDESPIIPFPSNRIVIVQNGAAHDAKFLSCEYLPPGPDKNVYLDIMAIASACRGIHPCQRAQWEKFRGAMATGKPAPDWVTMASDMDLASLTRDVCGIEIKKSVGEVGGPESLLEYCAQDIWATLLVFQELWPLFSSVICPSPAVWWGMGMVTGLRYPTGDWSEVLANLDEAKDRASAKKPADRDDDDKALIAWGKSHRQAATEGFSINGMMPLLTNPCHSVTGEHQSTIWRHEGIIKAIMTIGAKEAQWDAPGYEPMYAELADVPVLSKSLASNLATQSTVRTAMARSPHSLKDSKKAKADWLIKRPSIDAEFCMMALIDALCMEYEISMFPMVPGKRFWIFGVQIAKSDLFCDVVAQARKVTYEIFDIAF